MDLSKLPKLSQTSTRPANSLPPTNDPAPQIAPYSPPPPLPPAAEAWISIAVGTILLLMYPTLLKYLSSRLFHTSFAPFVNPDGTEVPYPKVYPQFLGDFCITLFAVVMIIDGIAIALIRSKLILVAILLLTILVTLMNLLFVIVTTATYGLPIASALAVAVGGYMGLLQITTLRRLCV